MRYEAEGGDPANAGLQHARLFLEPVKRAHPWVTYADLWTLAGVTAVEAMGGPEVPWRPGRTDFVDDGRVPPRGRLPDGALGAEHVRAVFYRMGFNQKEGKRKGDHGEGGEKKEEEKEEDVEEEEDDDGGDRWIVALCGAHNLGRCHAANSGFEGKWVNNPTRFSNQYFKLLLSEDWREKEVQALCPDGTTRGTGVRQFYAVDPVTEEELMMLPTDVALARDPVFRRWVGRYAADRGAFFRDFATAFGRLLELGIRRDEGGRVVGAGGGDERGGYVSAPLKAEVPGAEGQAGREAGGLARGNEKFRERAKL